MDDEPPMSLVAMPTDLLELIFCACSTASAFGAIAATCSSCQCTLAVSDCWRVLAWQNFDVPLPDLAGPVDSIRRLYRRLHAEEPERLTCSGFLCDGKVLVEACMRDGRPERPWAADDDPMAAMKKRAEQAEKEKVAAQPASRIALAVIDVVRPTTTQPAARLWQTLWLILRPIRSTRRGIKPCLRATQVRLLRLRQDCTFPRAFWASYSSRV